MWIQKWNWKKVVLKYLLSETINAPENGSSDTHFAKFLIPDFLKSLTYSSVCDVGVPFCRQVRWDIWSKQLAEISCDIDIEFDISSHFEFVASILVLFTWNCQHKKIYLIVRPRVKCTFVIPTRLLPVYERPVLNKETEMKKCSKIRPSSNISTGIIYSPESANHQKKRNYFWAQQHFCLVRKTRSWPVQKNSLWFPIINNDTYDVLAPQYLIQEIAYKQIELKPTLMSCRMYLYTCWLTKSINERGLLG